MTSLAKLGKVKCDRSVRRLIYGRGLPAMTLKPAAGLAMVSLTVCACQMPPAISDINDSAVKVQANGMWSDPSDVARAADEGCAIYGKGAVPISRRCIDRSGLICSTYEHLFACRGPQTVVLPESSAPPAPQPAPPLPQPDVAAPPVQQPTYPGAPPPTEDAHEIPF